MGNSCVKKDRYSDDKKERDYIKKMSLRDSRSWFRMRSSMTLRIKANRSSAFRNNMHGFHLGGRGDRGGDTVLKR